MPPGIRAYASGAFALELDGAKAGWLKSASGGEASAAVVSEPARPGGIVGKHLGAVHYSDIEVACQDSLDKPLLTWIQEFLGRKTPQRSGAISTLDYQYKETSRREFKNARLAAVAFPEFNAASKDHAAITMRVAPQSTEVKPGSGGAAGAAGKTSSWLASSFKLTIGGLDCTHVSGVASLTVGQPVQEAAPRAERVVAAGALEVGDLVVTLSAPHAQTWWAWHEDFVIKGNCDAAHEKSGKLELMTPDHKNALLTLSLSGLGIYSLVAAAQPQSESIRRVTASMYCEQAALTAPA